MENLIGSHGVLIKINPETLPDHENPLNGLTSGKVRDDNLDIQYIAALYGSFGMISKTAILTDLPICCEGQGS